MKRARGRPPSADEGRHSLSTMVPGEVYDAVLRAANASYEGPSVWARRIVIERLRADGLLPPITTYTKETS